jgi:hypothetical protein
LSKFKLAGDFGFLVFFILFLVSSMFAVTYLTSEDVFDAKISYVNDQKLPYSIILQIDNKVYDEIEFDVEIIFKKENLVVGSKRFECYGSCEEKINLNKIFFDDYLVEVVADYNGRRYKKELEFVLNEPEASFSVNLDPYYYIDEGKLFVDGIIFSSVPNIHYYLDIFPKLYPEVKDSFDFFCEDLMCDFNFNLTSDIFIGDYLVNVYSELDSSQESFSTFLMNKSVDMENNNLNDSKNNFVSDDVIYVEENQKEVDIFGSLDLIDSSKVVLEYYPTQHNEKRVKQMIECDDKCDFVLNIKKPIIFGDYQLNVYLPNGVFSDSFRIDPILNGENGSSDDVSGDNLNEYINDYFDEEEFLYLECEGEECVDDVKIDYNYFLNDNFDIDINSNFDVNNLEFIDLPDSVNLGDEFDFSILVEDGIDYNKLRFPKSIQLRKSDFIDKGLEILATKFSDTKNSLKYTGVADSEDGEFKIYDSYGNLYSQFELKVNVSSDVKRFESKNKIDIVSIKNLDNGKKDLEVTKNNGRVNFKDVSLEDIEVVEVIDVKNLNERINLDMVSDVVHVEADNFEQAQISLEKVEFVKNILVCNEFINEQCISGWEDSNLIFSQNNSHVEFNVTHFSAYVAEGSSYSFNVDFQDYSDVLISQGGSDVISLNVSCISGDCGLIDVGLYMTTGFTGYDFYEVTGNKYNEFSCSQNPTLGIDDGINVYNLGFEFPFYSQVIGSVDSVYFDTNGRLSFDDSASDYNPTVAEMIADENIAFLWADLGDGTYNNEYACLDQGVNKKYSVFRVDSQWYNGAGVAQSEVVLYNNGNVKINHGTVIPRSGGFYGLSAGDNSNYDYFATDASDYSDKSYMFYYNKGSLVSTIPATSPFWTGASQTQQVNLAAGESIIVSFDLNAVGAVNLYELYGVAISNSDNSLRSQSDDLNVFISDNNPPILNLITPIDGYVGSSIENIISFDASFTDDTSLLESEIFVWDNLGNLIYNVSDSLSGVADSSSWNLEFVMSGDYLWNVLVTDIGGSKSWAVSNRSLEIKIPTLNVKAYPVNYYEVLYNNEVEYEVEVTCEGNDCGDINVDLLMAEEYNLFDDFQGGFGNWQNVVGDDADWTWDRAGTTTGTTGPSIDHSLGTATGYYLYTEASNPNNPNKDFYLESLDINADDYLNINYWYHMYGSNMGSLFLDVFDGNSWINLASYVGNLGDVWFEDNLFADISENIQKVRFYGLTGNGFRSDMAIDDVSLTYSKFGLVSVGSGTPFFSRNQNTYTFSNMLKDETRTFIFRLNATGAINVSNNFKVLAYSNTNSLLNYSSNKTTIKIINDTLIDGKDLFYNSTFDLSSEVELEIKKNGVSLKRFKVPNGNFRTNQTSKNDLVFWPMGTSVKNIVVPNSYIKDVSIGFEEVSTSKVNLPYFVSDVFAIDPHFAPDVLTYNITFTATGHQVYKCSNYNFTAQNCFGGYVKILDTIPGQEYTIELTPTDPIIAQVSDYVLSPTGASCQENGNGWDSLNCDDISYTGSKLCPSGVGGEFAFCDDTYMEIHSMSRDLDGGVQMYFEDLTQSKCEEIIKVELLYKVWFATDDLTYKGIEQILIDADGDGYSVVGAIIDFSEPVSNRVLDVTNALPVGEYWNCSDFFSDTSTASAEAFYGGAGARNSGTYAINVDTLVYRVTYNYSKSAIETLFTIYEQSEIVDILGSQVWDSGAYANVSIIDSLGAITYLPLVLVNASNEFDISYTLGDYAPIGIYNITAFQVNDTSINETASFEVIRRTPIANPGDFFFAPGETIIFTGSKWLKSGVVNVSQIYPGGLLSPTYSGFVNTDSSGNFIYNHVQPDDLISDTGEYIFNFSENLNASYFDEVGVNLIFRPNSASNLSEINKSDGQVFNVGGSGATETLTFGFPPVLPSSGAILDSYEVLLEYATGGTTTRNVEWLNDTSGLYQVACTVPEGSLTYSCDLTNYVKFNNDFNSVNVRLIEYGGPAEDWYVNFVYVMRNFTINPPFVENIFPLNNTWSNVEVYQNFTYNVTNGFFNMSHCELYIDDILEDTDISITNDVDQYFNINHYFVEGNHSWYVSCIEDSSKLQRGNSSKFLFYVDKTTPNVSLISPLNDSFINQQNISFAANFSDLMLLANATLYVWDDLGLLLGTNFTSISGTYNSTNLSFNFLTEGTYYWNYLVYDYVGNSVFALNNFTINIDLINPNVTIISPVNLTKSNVLKQLFVANFTDDFGLKNATLRVYDSVGALLGTNFTSLSGLSDSVNLSFDFAGEGIYYWNYLVYDEAGNFNVLNENITLYLDTTLPVVNLTSPLNASFGNYVQLFLGNFSDNVALWNSTLHVWNETGSLIYLNDSIVFGTFNSSNLQIDFVVEGAYYWNYLVYDEAGNYAWNSVNYTLIIDLTPPMIELVSPENDTAVNISKNFFVGNFTDIVGLKNFSLLVYNSTGDLIGVNTSLISGKFNQSNLSFIFPYSGKFKWTFIACDLAANCNTSILNRTIYIDYIAPKISFIPITDANNSYVNRSWTYINVSIYDLVLDTVTLEFDGVNETMSCTGSTPDYVCGINKSMLKNNLYTYKVYANDSLGNMNVSELRYININRTLPVITVIFPIDGMKISYDDIIDFNVTTLVEADNVWMEFDANSTIYNLNQYALKNWIFTLANLTSGTRNLVFYANDSVDNRVNASISFYVIPNKNIEVNKSITYLGVNAYTVLINITNYGTYQDYIFHDFIDSNFNYYDLSLINSGFSAIAGTYDGDMLTWNLSLNQFDSQTILYKMNGTSDYNLLENFVVGMD